MTPRFFVLGSGSSGNSSLLCCEEFGMLIDVGLGPRQMTSRLREIGIDWEGIDAVFLTHTHSDHWRENTFAALLKREITLYCHAGHFSVLRRRSGLFHELDAAGLVAMYSDGEKLSLPGNLQVQAFALSHDAGPTFGFRVDRHQTRGRAAWAMAYVCDLGTWGDEFLELLSDLELLALEFNHDVKLQSNSGRPWQLIERVLGDQGHLSNDQAGELLRLILRNSRPGRLQHLVQLHLSRQCNHPHLARQAAEAVLAAIGHSAQVLTAHHRTPLCIDAVGV